MERDVNRFIDSIAKRVIPETQEEKTCIEKFGKMIIKRGHLKKAIIETISKYNTHDSSSSKDQQEVNRDSL